MQNCVGCGKPAAHQMANGKWYCALSHNACPAMQEKRRKTYLANYGVEHPNRSPEVQTRRRQHNVEKYGVDHPFKTKELQKRVADTNRERLGVDNPFASKTVQKKIKQTMLEKYGVENASQNPEIQARKVATFIKRYGVAHHFQNPMMFRIILKGLFRRKEVKAGGRVFMVQGAEDRVLLELLDNGFPADAIETDPGKVPVIWYTRLNGRRARYYPDIYIPDRKWIIEVKSMWTFLLEKENNLLKREACIKAGYKFNFIIR